MYDNIKMTEERYKEITDFEEKHSDMPDGAFWALAEENGLMPKDFSAAEEYAIAQGKEIE